MHKPMPAPSTTMNRLETTVEVCSVIRESRNSPMPMTNVPANGKIL